MFLGQFLNPIVVFALAGIAGGRVAAVILIGQGLLVSTGITLAASMMLARKPEGSEMIEPG